MINRGLKKKLENYESILIYGTGEFARKIYPDICELGYREKIKSFVVSKQPEEETFDGIEVHALDDVFCDKQKDAVLIATSRLYEDEIAKELRKRGFSHIVYLSGYSEYQGKLEPCLPGGFEEYCDWMAEWYVTDCARSGEAVEKESIKKALWQRGKAPYCEDDKLIVWICGLLTPRTMKIVGALKKHGYRIAMLEYLRKDVPYYTKEFQKIGITMQHCECVEAMMYYALQYNPRVYVIEPTWTDCSWAETMLRHKERFGKIAVSLYDIANLAYADPAWIRLETERYALENADGVIWRWFGKEYLEESKGITCKGKSIQFLDYCRGYESDANVLETRTDILKICIVGGAGKHGSNERVQHTFDTKGYVWEATLQDVLDVLGNRKDCLIHFYAAELADENIAICEEYQNQYENFQFFIGTSHDELIQKLSWYDYGCEPFTDGKPLPREMSLNGLSTGNDLYYFVANKYFDFLDAGLPIITTYSLELVKYLEQYGVVVKMNTGNFDVDFLQKNKEQYKENARQAKQKLHVEWQIVRLIEFFEDL